MYSTQKKTEPHFLKHIYSQEMKKNNSSVGKLQQILNYLN